MERKVIGAGFMFLASGCGPVLSNEQRMKLTSLKPDEFYPYDELLAILMEAKAKDPKIVYTTGKRWGGALNEEWTKRGITDVVEAQKTLCDIYLAHHQGDMGKLVIDEDGDKAVILTNDGPYPTELIAGAFEAVAGSLSKGETTLEKRAENKYRITWTGEG